MASESHDYQCGGMYGLLTKCEVKMAGYWPSSLFACLWTETKSRSINSQKRTRPISSHLDRANLVKKGFIIWLSGKFCLRDRAGSPKCARWLHLARSGSQSQRVLWVILPACGASHIINLYHHSCFFKVISLYLEVYNLFSFRGNGHPRVGMTPVLNFCFKNFLLWTVTTFQVL